MEEWRELARSVPGTLLLVVDGTTTRRLLASFDRTHGRLQRVVNLAVCLQSGDTDLGRPSAGPCPSVNVEETRRELDRLTALHGAAGRVFVLCAMFLGHRADPLWESWEVHGVHREQARTQENVRTQDKCCMAIHQVAIEQIASPTEFKRPLLVDTAYLTNQWAVIASAALTLARSSAALTPAWRAMKRSTSSKPSMPGRTGTASRSSAVRR